MSVHQDSSLPAMLLFMLPVFLVEAAEKTSLCWHCLTGRHPLCDFQFSNLTEESAQSVQQQPSFVAEVSEAYSVLHRG